MRVSSRGRPCVFDPAPGQLVMSLIWLFPGQSSRYAGMLSKIAGLAPHLPGLLTQASAVLGRDLVALDRSQAPFESNRDIQVSVFLANLLAQQALECRGLRAPYSLGLSLGQYNHLVHIGALSWPEALRLVDARGQAYDRGPTGAMASIQPASYEALVEMLGQRLGTPGMHGDLEIVNRNSPRQQVIAGARDAVQEACEYLEQEHYITPIVIERKIPMHASRFAPVAQAFAKTLERTSFCVPSAPLLCNTDAQLVHAPSPQELRHRLAKHVHSPVLWQKSVESIVRECPDAIMVEVGAMGVLSGLLNRRWLAVRKHKCDVKEGLHPHFEGLVRALSQAVVQGVAVPLPSGLAPEASHV